MIPGIPKPPHGAPCNSCGECCRHQVCPLAFLFFKSTTWNRRCPALEEQSDGRGLCGLVADPASYAPVRTMIVGADRMREAALRAIGAGHGCDAIKPGEREDHAFAARIRRVSDGDRARARKALALWCEPL